MKEDSIEDDIKNAEHSIDSIKTDKEYKEENGWHGYYNKEIVELTRILQHILSDYKRVLEINEVLLKENEELKFEERSRIIGKYGDAEIHDVINRTLSNDYISVKKIKDKIENLKKVKERNIKRDFDTVYKDGYFTGGIDALQELLESEE